MDLAGWKINTARISRGSTQGSTSGRNDYPSLQVASWLGHSPSIAARHYLKHKDLHVQAATGTGDWIQTTGVNVRAESPTIVFQKSGAECGASTVQNAVQHPAAPACMFSHFGTQPLSPCKVVRSLATTHKPLQVALMGGEGLEPPKAYASRFTVCPLCRLSIHPI